MWQVHKFFDIDHPEELPSILGNMLGHYDELKPKIADARAFAQDNMTWDSVTEQILQILENVNRSKT